MQVLQVRNVHEALPEAIRRIVTYPQSDSRNGPVRVASTPVATVYTHPTERVIFWPERDANPFFHLFESLWMLAGRNDVAWLAKFNSNIARFSDDDLIFRGAYGFRWRRYWAIDQLKIITENLKKNPNDRRQVLTMFDPKLDLLNQNSLDIPCNLSAVFSRAHTGDLDMTVFCRSNDIIWGCYGANAVHFSFLQEVLAKMIGCQIGAYTQISVNWHAYQHVLTPLIPLAGRSREPYGNHLYYNPYVEGTVEPYPILDGFTEDLSLWWADLDAFMELGTTAIGYQTRFFRRVAVPLLSAWQHFRHDSEPFRFENALEQISRCEASDWALAASEWIVRRKQKWTTSNS